VIGRVQGVYFRATTKEVAVKLGLVGFVMNKEDGSVFIHVEGEKGPVNQFLEWCRNGPENAVVDELVERECENTGFGSFEIKY